jgi:VanZ family protein
MSTRARRITTLSLLGIVIVAGALVMFLPAPVDRALRGSLNEVLDAVRAAGLPNIFRYGVLEFGGNILLFIPLGFVLALLMPRGRRWMAPTLCVAGSFAAEFAQSVLLPERHADPTDVLGNTIGGLIGTLLVVVFFRRKPQRRD